MDGRCSMGGRNNQLNDGLGGGMDVGEAIIMGGTRGGGRLLIAFGGEWSDEKNKNREGNGASDFDGFFWMGGHNNQPKSSLNVGVYYLETARRAMTISEDTNESFQPSEFGAKK